MSEQRSKSYVRDAAAVARRSPVCLQPHGELHTRISANCGYKLPSLVLHLPPLGTFSFGRLIHRNNGEQRYRTRARLYLYMCLLYISGIYRSARISTNSFSICKTTSPAYMVTCKVACHRRIRIHTRCYDHLRASYCDHTCAFCRAATLARTRLVPSCSFFAKKMSNNAPPCSYKSKAGSAIRAAARDLLELVLLLPLLYCKPLGEFEFLIASQTRNSIKLRWSCRAKEKGQRNKGPRKKTPWPLQLMLLLLLLLLDAVRATSNASNRDRAEPAPNTAVYIMYTRVYSSHTPGLLLPLLLQKVNPFWELGTALGATAAAAVVYKGRQGSVQSCVDRIAGFAISDGKTNEFPRALVGLIWRKTRPPQQHQILRCGKIERATTTTRLWHASVEASRARVAFKRLRVACGSRGTVYKKKKVHRCTLPSASLYTYIALLARAKETKCAAAAAAYILDEREKLHYILLEDYWLSFHFLEVCSYIAASSSSRTSSCTPPSSRIQLHKRDFSYYPPPTPPPPPPTPTSPTPPPHTYERCTERPEWPRRRAPSIYIAEREEKRRKLWLEECIDEELLIMRGNSRRAAPFRSPKHIPGYKKTVAKPTLRSSGGICIFAYKIHEYTAKSQNLRKQANFRRKQLRSAITRIVNELLSARARIPRVGEKIPFENELSAERDISLDKKSITKHRIAIIHIIFAGAIAYPRLAPSSPWRRNFFARSGSLGKRYPIDACIADKEREREKRRASL
ncbi:unnamed protein product [Trichogramma brassicae]|uniref:Uncharacterized protein n=1 Tax=Trichogramma brassicae TaxID=86971 RepID=A0A6H5IBU6_9HYME|nr:unnamed protein product [Trichogramma brassicae]